MTAQLFYNLLARDALLIHDGVAHALSGPFVDREHAEQAAAQLIASLIEDGGRASHDQMAGLTVSPV